jgi:hypothetical protein
MNARVTRLPARAGTRGAGAPPIIADPLRPLRWLIWSYFLLLIFEGGLRKWAFPSLANALLIVRDPVLIVIYGFALSRRAFPGNGFMFAMLFLASMCFVISFATEFGDWRVALFGVRCNYLHLPLIFIIGSVFKIEDVRRIGWVVLALAIPMAALMALQFRSPGDAWINRGAGAEALMITSVEGRIRPSGTFSFVSGIIYFWSLVTAFLVYGLVQKRAYPLWLTVSGAVALPIAVAVSSSRSTLAACAIVVGAFAVALFCRPQLIFKSAKLLLLAFILASAVGGMALFQEGLDIFTKRVEHASDVEGGFGGFVQRFIYQFVLPLRSITTVPMFGYGLGSGTNVGAKLLTGEIQYILAEDEWERVILESGPAAGLSYLLLRLCIAAWLAWLAWRAARIGHFLPMLLVGAAGWTIVCGQFGQATTLGFAVFMGGLALASLRIPESVIPELVRAKKFREEIVPLKVRAQWAAINARKAAARRNVPRVLPDAPA